MLHDLKVVAKTIMFISVLGFGLATYYLYNNQSEAAPVEEVYEKPDFEHTSNQTFLDNVNQCIEYIYNTTTDIEPINKELLLAQASLESGWGTSRFARVGKNLFGIRTYDLTEPHMLPSNNPKKWGVKVYEHECDSVLHYINTLNRGTAFKKYQDLRYLGENDPIKLLHTLDAYASDKNYFVKVERIIKLIREEYNY